ncbi:MAG: hypothetical protein ATN36_02830 [Epulopiscium sp. Nele67-Bin005]|nr:MAG: hypothetical protein ATN36_02830 [Epulopiscium sp. Nele67-Bin005]
MKKNLQTEKRNYLLDNLKGLLIFLVVFGHSIEIAKNNSVLIETIYIFIYLFHMPVFVFVSGYFSKNVEKSRSKAFRSFFVPFLIFNTIWNGLSSIALGFESFSFLTPGWALWYLMSMFLWRISLKDLIKVRFIFPLSIIVGVGAGLFSEFGVILSLSRTLVFLPFFLAGFYTTEQQLFKLKESNLFLSICIFIFTITVSMWLGQTHIIPAEFLYGNSSFTNYPMSIWVGILARLSLYIVGFLFVFVLINFVPSRYTFFSQIGSNTFSVYILHTYLVGLVFIANSYISSPNLQLILCFVTSIIITYILSRNIVTKYFTKSIDNFLKFFRPKQSF